MVHHQEPLFKHCLLDYKIILYFSIRSELYGYIPLLTKSSMKLSKDSLNIAESDSFTVTGCASTNLCVNL